MEYEQITQSSRPYRYGENEEFKTKEEAMGCIKKLMQEVNTKLALLQLYDKSEVNIYESDSANVLILVLKIKIPRILKGQ